MPSKFNYRGSIWEIEGVEHIIKDGDCFSCDINEDMCRHLNENHETGEINCPAKNQDKCWRKVSNDKFDQYISIESIAKTCHEVNRAYCQSIGDFSQMSWEESPEWQRESCINGVKFHLETPGASPSASHNNWLKEKIEAGWKYGPIKDPEKKEHPCCVAYDELPAEQKAKDLLFISVVNSLREFI